MFVKVIERQNGVQAPEVINQAKQFVAEVALLS